MAPPADQPTAPADDFFSSGAVVKGSETYYLAQFNNRTIHLSTANVTAATAK